jgi:hypothetical protein
MSRKYILLFLFPFLLAPLTAKSTVDCKVVTGTVTQCNPYSFKFLRAKKVKYDKNRQKLIVDKTLPLPPKSDTIRIRQYRKSKRLFPRRRDRFSKRSSDRKNGKNI